MAQQKSKKKQMGVFGLVIALIVTLVGGVLFVGAASGWFDNKTKLDEEEYNYRGEIIDISSEEYERMAKEKKSFVVFVDQGGCVTADTVEGFINDWMDEKNVKIYRISFSDMKETALHDAVKYYPSLAVINKGKPVVWLKADSEADADAYNEYDAFKKWVAHYIL